MDLKIKKRNPKLNDGWNFDYSYIRNISYKTQSTDFPVGMEEVESVLLIIWEAENAKVEESNCNIPDVNNNEAFSEVAVCADCGRAVELKYCDDCYAEACELK